MRIAFRGNFQPEQETPWSTESHLAATLEAMGHAVLRLQENAVGWDVVEHVAKTCDLLLWVKTWSIDNEGAYRTLSALKGFVPTASFHLDLYFGLARAVQVADDPFWRTDWVFTADGGHPDSFARLGINHVWSPPAVYEAEIGEGEPTEEFTADVGFVGSFPYPHSEWAHQRATLMSFLRQTYGGAFHLWRGGVRGRDLNNLYASVKVVVGDSCLAGMIPRFFSDRIPETVGRGGFLIHPYIEGIEEHYKDGEHLRLYEQGDYARLRFLIDHYLANDGERRAIARSGMEHVRANHTYRHRLQRILDVVATEPAPTGTQVLLG